MSLKKFKDEFMISEDKRVKLYEFPTGSTVVPRVPSLCEIAYLGKKQDCIFLGEPGSGLRNVYKWYVENLGEAFVTIRFNFMEFAVVNCDDESRKERAEDYADQLRGCATSHECLEVLRDWIKAADMCRFVLFKPESKLSQNFAQAFRTLRDEENKSFKLVIFTTSDDTFVDSAVQSGYLSLSAVYRMPRIGPEDVVKLGLGLTPDRLGHILRFTGGQPILFEHFLENLKSIEPNMKDWDNEVINLTSECMMRDLPHPVELWQTDLKKRISDDPGIRDRLEKYLSSKLEPHRGVPAADLGLFFSGWLGHLDDGWGIASHIHRYLVRKVLLER